MDSIGVMDIRILLKYGVLLLLSGCKTSGYFTSNPKDHGAFAGSYFKLNKDGTFHRNQWTDVYSVYTDSLGNRIWKDYQKEKRIGKGTYQKKRDSLELTFTNEDSVRILIDFQETEDSFFIEIEEFSEMGDPAYLNYELLNSSDSLLAIALFHIDLKFRTSKEANPWKIRLGEFKGKLTKNYILLEDLKPGFNEIKIKTYAGYYAKGDRIVIWHRRGPSGMRYALGNRKTWMPRRWKWKFLNKFYPNRSYPIYYGKKLDE